MILVASLLTVLGASDLTRPSDVAPTKQQRARTWFLGVALIAIVGWGLDLAPWVALVGFTVAAGWWLVTPATRHTPWAVAGLAVLLVVLALFVEPTLNEPAGPFVNWLDQSRPPLFEGIAFSVLALAIGGLAFLLNTANIIIRVLIDRTDIKKQMLATDGDEVREVGDRDDEHQQEHEQEEADEQAPLRGGRFLGPVERILIVSLGIAGQFTAIAAIVGAKSIIRFPEISKSDQRGAAAEYFLIGSGISWGISLLVLAVLKLS